MTNAPDNTAQPRNAASQEYSDLFRRLNRATPSQRDASDIAKIFDVAGDDLQRISFFNEDLTLAMLAIAESAGLTSSDPDILRGFGILARSVNYHMEDILSLKSCDNVGGLTRKQLQNTIPNCIYFVERADIALDADATEVLARATTIATSAQEQLQDLLRHLRETPNSAVTRRNIILERRPKTRSRGVLNPHAYQIRREPESTLLGPREVEIHAVGLIKDIQRTHLKIEAVIVGHMINGAVGSPSLDEVDHTFEQHLYDVVRFRNAAGI